MRSLGQRSCVLQKTFCGLFPPEPFLHTAELLAFQFCWMSIVTPSCSSTPQIYQLHLHHYVSHASSSQKKAHCSDLPQTGKRTCVLLPCTPGSGSSVSLTLCYSHASPPPCRHRGGLCVYMDAHLLCSYLSLLFLSERWRSRLQVLAFRLLCEPGITILTEYNGGNSI